MSDSEFRGAVRHNSSMDNYWGWTNSDVLLIDAKDEDVVLASTREEVIAELKVRFPDLEPDYGYIHEISSNYFQGIAWHYDAPRVHASNMTLERLQELAFKYKEVEISEHVFRAIKGRDLELSHGFVVRHCNYRVLRIAYNQKAAKKHAEKVAKKHENEEKVLITLRDIDECRFGIVLDECLHNAVHNKKSANSLFGCSCLAGTIWIGIKFYGVAKLRKLDKVAAFLVKWKRNEDANVAKYSDVVKYGTCGLLMIEQINKLLVKKRRLVS